MYAVIVQYIKGGCAKRILLYQNRKAYRTDANLQKLIDENRLFVVNEQAEIDEIVNMTKEEIKFVDFSQSVI